MANIPIISRRVITTTGEPDRWRFGITKWFADQISTTDPTDELHLIINGDDYNVTADVYSGITNSYPDYFYIVNEGYNYFLEFINTGTTYFNDYKITDCVRFYAAIYDEQTNSIQSLFDMQIVNPVYNPITFRFISDNVYQQGFKYIFKIKDVDENELGVFKIAPRSNGSGYIDISKFLSNYTSFDFNGEHINDNCKNSYVKWMYSIGEEYIYNVGFDYIASYSIDGIVYVSLVFPDETDFIVDSYIQIKHNDLKVNGLHRVISKVGNQIIIPVLFSSISIYSSGTVMWSDSRKKSYPDLFDDSKKIFLSFNGALSWVKELNEYDYRRYVSYDDAWLTDNNSKLLTSLRPANNLYYLADYNQPFYINWLLNAEQTDFKLSYYIRTKTYDDQLTPYLQTDSTPVNPSFVSTIPWQVRQARVDPSYYGMDIPSGGYWSFALYSTDQGPTETMVSQEYWFKNDERCKITENIIQYMDRFGSILSFQFPLRVEQKGTITKNMTKQQQEFNITSDLVYDTFNGGTTINNINMTRDFMLTTNWMSELDLTLFEVLMTSPFVWYIIDGIPYACQVQDKDFQVETQKNKKLIKKTITIRLAMDQIINI